MSEFNFHIISENITLLTDKILAHFAGPKFSEDLKNAKTDFFEHTSVLDEKSPQFDLRMSQFFDWYLFSRPLMDFHQTPLNSVSLVRELRFEADELASIKMLQMNRHSLFRTAKIKGANLTIEDLIYKQNLLIRNCPWIEGFQKKEIFEARLIPVGEDWVFTRGLCFHPIEASKFILSEIKTHQKDPDLDKERMMFRLMKMRYRFERYKHVQVDAIYNSDFKGV